MKPGEVVFLERETEKPISEKLWEGVQEKGDSLVIDGWISYTDELGLVRTTGFCRGQGGQEGASFSPFGPMPDAEYED